MNSTVTNINQRQQAIFTMMNNHFKIACCLMGDNNPLL